MTLLSKFSKSSICLATIAAVTVVALLLFVFAPSPSRFEIQARLDAERGHPHETHGSRPTEFVGLWVRDAAKENDYSGQAFFLTDYGPVAGEIGMASRRWHFDDGSFFIDSWSMCGNCNRGNETAEYSVEFLTPDKFRITNRDPADRGEISGVYQRFAITDALRAKMTRLKGSKDRNQSFRAQVVLQLVEMFGESPCARDRAECDPG